MQPLDDRTDTHRRKVDSCCRVTLFLLLCLLLLLLLDQSGETSSFVLDNALQCERCFIKTRRPEEQVGANDETLSVVTDFSLRNTSLCQDRLGTNTTRGEIEHMGVFHTAPRDPPEP